MSEFERNKIFAAILIAGITIWLSDFVAHKFIHAEKLEKDAVFVEGAPVAASTGSKKKQTPDPILHLIASADIAKGEKLSKACAACHSFDQSGPNKVGPNLWEIVENKKGHTDGFAYSNALLEKGGAWSYQNLNFFLWKPKKYISGTKMNYIGLRKAQDRADLIAWLRTKAPAPAALPSQAAITAEIQAFAPEQLEVPAEAQAVQGALEAGVEAAEDAINEAEEAVENAEDLVPTESEIEDAVAEISEEL